MELELVANVMELPFKTEFYKTLQMHWPTNGKVILHSSNINVTDDTIILYQAYNSSIAEYAVAHQTFSNCKDFSTNRMTWLKPNFCWMMYRSGWATKPNQERILAITMKKVHFNEILMKSVSTSKREIAANSEGKGNQSAVVDVRLQWDPDHDPFGGKLERRAIQIGIRGKALDIFLTQQILSICDITDFVREQSKNVESERLDFLCVPAECVYTIDDELLRNHIKLD
ncbi:hypothetical protein Bhyg_15891 [Pseudolycoriella hygida]|uniref:DUF4291 domain-containing protein n=1 Tax=Pseudolycoriella hygida TaxID=35572 RepID=A0A9Q0MKB5_9DIPT|nr:hypothetical protein Bhyg_15891 [Pseudolycoriella hygida]